MKLEVDKYRRLREEYTMMQNEENLKTIIDTKVYKDKIEQQKVELHDLRKVCKELERYQCLY